jgi:hypothetical protein
MEKEKNISLLENHQNIKSIFCSQIFFQNSIKRVLFLSFSFSLSSENSRRISVGCFDSKVQLLSFSDPWEMLKVLSSKEETQSSRK